MLRVAQFTTTPREGQRGGQQLRLAATPDEFQAWLAAWLPWITGADALLRPTFRAGAMECSRHARVLTVVWPREAARSSPCESKRAGPSAGAEKKKPLHILALGIASR